MHETLCSMHAPLHPVVAVVPVRKHAAPVVAYSPSKRCKGVATCLHSKLCKKTAVHPIHMHAHYPIMLGGIILETSPIMKQHLSLHKELTRYLWSASELPKYIYMRSKRNLHKSPRPVQNMQITDPNITHPPKHTHTHIHAQLNIRTAAAFMCTKDTDRKL